MSETMENRTNQETKSKEGGNRIAFWQGNLLVIEQISGVLLLIVLCTFSAGASLSWCLLGYGLAILLNSKIATQGRQQLLLRPALIFMILAVTMRSSFAYRLGGLLSAAVYFGLGTLCVYTKLGEKLNRISLLTRQSALLLVILTMVAEVSALSLYGGSGLRTLAIVVFLGGAFALSLWKPAWKWGKRILVILGCVFLIVGANWQVIGAQLSANLPASNGKDLAEQLLNWLLAPLTPSFWQAFLPTNWQWSWSALLLPVAALLNLPEVITAAQVQKNAFEQTEDTNYGNVFASLALSTVIMAVCGLPLPTYSVESAGVCAKEKAALLTAEDEGTADMKKKFSTSQTAAIILIVAALIPALTFFTAGVIAIFTPVFALWALFCYYETAPVGLPYLWQPCAQALRKIFRRAQNWPTGKQWLQAATLVVIAAIAWRLPIWYLGTGYLVKFPSCWYGIVISACLAFLLQLSKKANKKKKD